jgi:diaminopimelate decarboxylase
MSHQFLPEVFSSNSAFADGQLSIAGIKAERLAQEFGTPLFVIDEQDFMDRARAWKSALDRHFGAQAGNVYYASKSFISIEVAKWVKAAGIGIDVCTGGEMAVALAADFDPALIEVHGNNKSESEIAQAISVGAAIIVIDSHHEIERVNRLASAAGKIQKVYLRLTPGVEAHTHEFISTAHEDVKFGFSIASGAAWRAVEEISALKNISLAGIHMHIGSQIFEVEGFKLAAERLIGFLAKYRDHFDAQLPDLDLGGGYGIAYLPGESSVDPDEMMATLATIVKAECAAQNLNVPRISIEPGRAIVGPTTTTLYRVGTTKNVELDAGASRRYVAVDGGMSDNIRPALYDAEYFALLANRSSTSAVTSSRLVGKHCETGDIIIREIDLPSDVAPGDLLAIPATGAYGRSMASNYNHVPRPAVVAVNNGSARVILRRETESDLLALDVNEVGRKLV